MRIVLHKDFTKQYLKLSKKIQVHVDERLITFALNPTADLLHNHPLKGIYKGYSSINITGDYRAIYKIIDTGVAVFTDIDTHDKLYR